MSTQAASDFFNKLYTDANMRKNLETQMGDLEHPIEGGIERGFGERIAQVGKQHGFDFDADEAKDAYKIFLGRFSGNLEGADAELSDSDLASVAGGMASTKTSSGSSTCCKTC